MMQKRTAGPPVYLAFLFIGPLVLAIGLYDTLTRPGINALPIAAGCLLFAAGWHYRKQARALQKSKSEKAASPSRAKATVRP